MSDNKIKMSTDQLQKIFDSIPQEYLKKEGD